MAPRLQRPAADVAAPGVRTKSAQAGPASTRTLVLEGALQTHAIPPGVRRARRVERGPAWENLGTSHPELRAILDAAPVMTLVVDRDWRVRGVNRRVEEWSGSTASDLIGGTAGEALGCLSRLPVGCGCDAACSSCAVRRAIAETLDRGAGHGGIEAGLPGELGRRVVRVSTTPVTWDGTQAALAFVEDITELRAAQDTYADVAQAIPTGLVVLEHGRSSGLTLSALNAAAEAMTGLVAERAVGRAAEATWPEAWPRDLLDRLQEAASTGESFRTETAVTCEGQGRRTFAVRAIPMSASRLGVVLEETTAARRAEQALADSEARHRALFEDGGTPAGLLDAGLRWSACNSQLQRLTGRGLDELLGRSPVELAAPSSDDGAAPGEALLAALEAASAGASRRIELEIQRPGGSRVVADCTVSRLELAGGPCVQLTAHDVTERRRAEEALRESEAVLRALVESTSSVIAVLDRQHRLSAFNLAFAEVMRAAHGVEARQGLCVTDAFAPEEQQWWMDRVRRALSGEVVRDERPKDVAGEQRIFGASFNPVVRDGEVIGVSLFARDITERRDAEQALRVLSRRLLHAQEDERRRISHELHDEIGQVLTAVKIGLQRLERGEAGRSAAPRVAASIRAVDRAIGDVRRLCLGLRPPLLDELGLEAALLAHARRLERDAGLEIDVSARDLHGLPVELEIVCFRVIQEALTNVLRHAKAARVSVEARVEGERLRLAVRDDGVGFDLKTAAARGTMGRGVGLASMRERVGLLGGELEIDSRPGAGSEVRAWLPVSSRSARASDARP